MKHGESIWLNVIGVLLILLGLVMFASPRVAYMTRERVISTGSFEVSAKRKKMVVIPRFVSTLTIGAGLIVLVIAKRKPQ
jgi:hypothetical protein